MLLWYFIIAVIAFVFFLCTDWAEAHNSSDSVEFKVLFCFISALVWPLFLLTITLDLIVVIIKKRR